MFIETHRRSTADVELSVVKVADDEAGKVRYHGNGLLKRCRHQTVVIWSSRLTATQQSLNKIYSYLFIYSTGTSGSLKS